MKWSRALIPTMRETPADAEIPSHQLMLRAGLIRKLAAGVYNYLPLGLKVLRKFENIVRAEMNLAGAQEVLLPTLAPASLWRQTGRWEAYGPELMRITDRHKREFALGPTHEEVITDLVRREVKSYRQFPLTLYQIQTKFRDEIRPRFGVMRGREFGMKDAYSFHTNQDDLDKTYWEMYEVYSNIFKRCGLKFQAVEAESGPIGGSSSHEFMVLAGNGEDLILACPKCHYAANREKTPVGYLKPASQEQLPLTKVATPGQRTIAEVSAFLKVQPSAMIKTLLYQGDGQTVAALIRGDRTLNETKLKNHLKVSTLVLANETTVREVTGAETGYAGPFNLGKTPIVADLSLAGRDNLVSGANENNFHYQNVNAGRDFRVEAYVDLANAEENDPCPKCEGTLSEMRGIEVGHIFKLGTKYSAALNATFLDEKGEAKPIIMGCYGIGTGRTIAAAIEQNHDENGIIWPLPIAPYQVVLTSLDPKYPEVNKASERIYRELILKNVDVIWDERDERPGVKFKDADLLGIPIRINIGKRKLREGKVEIRLRHDQSCFELSPIEVISRVQELIQTLSP